MFMRNGMWKKVLVIGIIVFFIDVSIVSGLNININSINSSQLLNRGWLYVGESSEKQSYNLLLDQDPLITEMIQQINESNIYSSVYTLQNFTTRFYGTSGNIAASTWIYNKLSSIPGLTVEYQGGEEYRNVIATLPGDDERSGDHRQN